MQFKRGHQGRQGPWQSYVNVTPGRRLVRLPATVQFIDSDLGPIAKNVRMAANQFFREPPDYVIEVKFSGFLGDTGVKNDMKQQVTQLLAKRLGVLPLGGIGDFESLFDRKRGNACRGLGPIPRASPLGVTQAPHQFKHRFNPLRFAHVRSALSSAGNNIRSMPAVAPQIRFPR